MSFEIEGIQELVDMANDIGSAANKLQNKALRQGAAIFEDEMRKRAPESDVPRKPTAKQKWRTGDHASKLIKAGSVISGKNGKYILTGIQRGDNSEAFYLKFHEFGTSKMNAQPFVAPSYESKKEEVRRAVAEELRNGLAGMGLFT